jgi:sugar transferase (PEP-CTERM system associated)
VMIRPKFFIILADLLLAFGSLILAHLLRFIDLSGLDVLWDGGLPRIVVFLLLVIFTAYFFELYDTSKIKQRDFIIRRTLISLFVIFLLLAAFSYLFPSLRYWRGVSVLAVLLTGIGQIGLRLVILKFLRVSKFASRTLILGVGEYANKIEKIIPKDSNPHSYIGFVSCTKEKSVVAPERIVGNISELGDLIHDYRPHIIIIALTERRGALPLKDIMHSKLRGIEVLDAASYYEQQTGCLLVEDIQPSAFIYTNGFRMTEFMRSYKRIFDILTSSLGLLFVAPFLPFIALAVKLDSPGPILYKQLRVGEREVEYFVYKFRTMSQNAESETGAVWAQKEDPRVTKVGRLFRKTRVDEIPQLYNVLKGDMSFIGPRPERLAFVERLKQTIPYYSTRHFVKPGVTGWAQVRYPYGASEEDALEKLRYDLFYIKNYSIMLDFKIIIETVRVVLSGFGGR